jgi:uncharacterized protein YfaA (DUF2138 family)
MKLSPRISKRLIIGALIGALIGVTTLGIFAQQLNSWQRYDAGGGELTIDLTQPDALIRSSHLARLPRDLLAQPLLKDLLDEEFVFYYEQNADRLGLAGALRRIAYEHELEWSDRLIAEVLDEPAEVALWRDDKGALRHFALLLRRNTLEKILEQAASVALKDKQLKLAGSLQAGGDQVKVLSLDYAPRRTLLIASRGERVVVLSAPGMLLDRENAVKPEAAAVVGNLLAADAQAETFFTQHFAGTPLASNGHQLMLGANVLSLGYQHFFPGLEAARFDFGAQNWSTHVRLAPQQLSQDALNGAELWQALPAGPAACALLPVDWQQAGKQLRDDVSQGAGGAQQFDALLAQAGGPAAACWYRDGRLATPLFVTRLRGEANEEANEANEAELTAQLGELFAWSMPKGGGDITPARNKETTTWTRAAQLAPHAKGEEGAQTKIALALAKQYVLFSPDARLVERAVAAIEKRHPNVGETLPEAARRNTLVMLNPKALSAMVKREAEQTLRDEPVLSQALARQLGPRLEKVAKYQPMALVAKQMPTAGDAVWVPVEWLDLPNK